MKIRVVLMLCVSALACLAIGCGAASQANFSRPTSPSNPSNDPSATLQITTTQLPDGSPSSPYSAQLSASGGVAPYVWSLNGELPAGLTMSSSGVIAGTPTTPGQSTLTVEVQDSEQQPQTAQVSLALDVANGVRAAATTTSIPTQFYGAGRGADSLANCVVGPYGDVVAYRFVAQHSAALTQVRFYIIPDHAGYAGGDAGSLKVAIETDDGTSAHNPSGTVLAAGELASPLAVTGSARYFPLITLSSPANLTAGQIYHVVFANTDPSPSINFLSVDELYYKQATAPNQPTVSDMASAVLRWRNGWQRLPNYSPIFQLYFSNGDYQGYGYVEAFVMAPEPVSGASQVRETFTVSGGARSISSIGIRLARLSGTGNLTVRLENSAGTLIEQGYISASSLPVTSPASYVWTSFKFATAVSLASGQTYHLVLQAPSSSKYETYSVQKGTAYGFSKLTYFPDGYAQFNPGTGWVGWSVWGVTNRKDSDLQFYFGVGQ
jgi:hypothetical protein